MFRLKELFYTSFCPANMPWFYQEMVIGNLKRIGTKSAFVFRKKSFNLAFVYCQIFFWPLITAFHSIKNCTQKKAALVKKEYNTPVFIQFLKMVWLANRFNIHPNDYYDYELFKLAKVKESYKYFYNPNLSGIIGLLGTIESKDMLDDKFKFYQLCTEHGLSTTDVILLQNDNFELEWISSSLNLPKIDLFIKPVASFGGHGAEIWCYHDGFWFRDSKKLNEEEVLNYVKKKGENERYCIMKRELPHESVLCWTTEVLPTYRVVTYIDKFSNIKVLAVMLRIPSTSKEVDNLCSGGIGIAVDENGNFMSGVTSGPILRHIEKHPIFNTQIKGVKAPFFKESIMLSVKAHTVLSDRFTIGWDIGIGRDGPILLEGNATWGAAIQSVSGIPFGKNTEFTELADNWLKNGSVLSPG